MSPTFGRRAAFAKTSRAPSAHKVGTFILASMLGMGALAGVALVLQAPTAPAASPPATEYTQSLFVASTAAPAPGTHTVTMGEVWADRQDAANKAEHRTALHAELNSPMPMSDITGDLRRDVADMANDAN